MAKNKVTSEQLVLAKELGLDVNSNMLETTVSKKIKAKQDELDKQKDVDETKDTDTAAADVVIDETKDETKDTDAVLITDVVDESETTTTEDFSAKETDESVVLLGTDEIEKLLKEPGVSISDKLKKIQAAGNRSYVILVTKLFAYAESMSKTKPTQTEKLGAGKNYDIYSSIKQVIELKDYKEFKVKFDIINAVFKLNADDAYSKFAMPRYDTSWRWGEKSLNTYLVLVSLIGGLCDRATRSEKLKTYSVDKALDKGNVELKEDGINNLRKYYS